MTEIKAFNFTMRQDFDILRNRSRGLVKESILDGLVLTGAPGQPIRTGALYKSWSEKFIGKNWEFSSDLFYATYVEDNVLGYTFRNHGPHSVKLTIAAWERIVDFCVAELRGNV